MTVLRKTARGRRLEKRFGVLIDQRIKGATLSDGLHFFMTAPRTLSAVEHWISATIDVSSCATCCDNSASFLDQVLGEVVADYQTPIDDDLRREMYKEAGASEPQLSAEEIALEARLSGLMAEIVEMVRPKLASMIAISREHSERKKCEASESEKPAEAATTDSQPTC